MSGLLEEVLKRVESLPESEQDAIASQILATLDDDAAWERHFEENAELFRSLAAEALDERRRG